MVYYIVFHYYHRFKSILLVLSMIYLVLVVACAKFNTHNIKQPTIIGIMIGSMCMLCVCICVFVMRTRLIIFGASVQPNSNKI